MDNGDIVNLIAANEWQLLVAVALTGFVFFARQVVKKARIVGTTGKVVSVVSSYIQGIAILLPTTQAWWVAVVAALGATLTSAGMVDLTADFVKWVVTKSKSKPVVPAPTSSSDKITPNETPMPRPYVATKVDDGTNIG